MAPGGEEVGVWGRRELGLKLAWLQPFPGQPFSALLPCKVRVVLSFIHLPSLGLFAYWSARFFILSFIHQFIGLVIS